MKVLVFMRDSALGASVSALLGVMGHSPTVVNSLSGMAEALAYGQDCDLVISGDYKPREGESFGPFNWMRVTTTYASTPFILYSDDADAESWAKEMGITDEVGPIYVEGSSTDDLIATINRVAGAA